MLNPEMIKIMGNVLLGLLVVTGLVMLVHAILKKIRKEKEKTMAILFADKLSVLLWETTGSAYRAWGQNGIERFLKNGYLKPLIGELTVQLAGSCNNYIAYVVVTEYLDGIFRINPESLTLFDFPEHLSIEKLLQKIKKRADDYMAAKIRVENEGFIQAESFFGPQKIFLKIEKGDIYFIFLEDLNYYISFECQEMLHRFLERKNEGKNIPRHVAGFYASICFLEKEKKFVVEFESGRAEESFRFACPIASFNAAFDKALEKYSPEYKKQ